MENNKKYDVLQFYKNTDNMRYFLDGIIEQRRDLGELAREIELLLRIAGVTASSDPKLPNYYH